MRFRCALSWCQRIRSPDQYISLHTPPRDEEKQKPWLEFINRPELYDLSAATIYNTIRVCSIHFRPNQFRFITAYRSIMDSFAVPCIRRFSNDPPFYANRDICGETGDISCPVKGCGANERDNPDLTFHRLHMICLKRLASWRKILGLNPEDRSTLVCSRHFGAHQYSPLQAERSLLKLNEDPMFRIGPINPIFNDYSPFPLQQVVLYEAFMNGDTIDLDLILKTFEGNLSYEELKALIIYMGALATKTGKTNFVAQIPVDPPPGLSEQPSAAIHRVHDPTCLCWYRINRAADVTDGGASTHQASESAGIASNLLEEDDQITGDTTPSVFPEPEDDELLLWHQQFEPDEDISSANRVLVMTKQDGKDWTMGETRDATWVLIKKLLNLRLKDKKYKDKNRLGCNFSGSSLVSPKLFMILCSNVYTANIIMEDLADDINREGWSVNYWPDVRKPVIEAFIPGCIISKVYAMRMMEFFNRGKGLQFAAWSMAYWSESDNGVYLGIEVPLEDGFSVQRLGTLYFELRSIKFEVRWPNEIDRLMQSIVTPDKNMSVITGNEECQVQKMISYSFLDNDSSKAAREIKRSSRDIGTPIDVRKSKAAYVISTKPPASYQTEEKLEEPLSLQGSQKPLWTAAEMEESRSKLTASEERKRVRNERRIDDDEIPIRTSKNRGAAIDLNVLSIKVDVEDARKDFESEEQRKLMAERLMEDSVAGRLLETKMSVAANTGVKTYCYKLNCQEGSTIDKYPSEASPNDGTNDCAASEDDVADLYATGDPQTERTLEVCERPTTLKCDDAGKRKMVLVDGEIFCSDIRRKLLIYQNKICNQVYSKALTLKPNRPAESSVENAKKHGHVKFNLASKEAWKTHLENKESKKLGRLVDVWSNIAANAELKSYCQKNTKNDSKMQFTQSLSVNAPDLGKDSFCAVTTDENLYFETVSGDSASIEGAKSLDGSSVEKKKRKKRRPLDDTGSTVMSAGLSVSGSEQPRAEFQNVFRKAETEEAEDFESNAPSMKIMKTYCRPRSDRSRGVKHLEISKGGNDGMESSDPGALDPLSIPMASSKKSKSLLNINGEIVDVSEEDIDSLELIT